MCKFQNLIQPPAVRNDSLPVERSRDCRIILIQNQAVQTAQQSVARRADFKTVHFVIRGFRYDTFHIIHIQRSRMHQRPCDFRQFIHNHDSFFYLPTLANKIYCKLCFCKSPRVKIQEKENGEQYA